MFTQTRRHIFRNLVLFLLYFFRSLIKSIFLSSYQAKPYRNFPITIFVQKHFPRDFPKSIFSRIFCKITMKKIAKKMVFSVSSKQKLYYICFGVLGNLLEKLFCRLPRVVFRTLLNIYDGVTFSRKLF